MDVAITGSSGLIGGALTRALERSGNRVVRVVRPETAARGADTVVWDPRTGTIDRAGLEGVDAVVHLAGAGIGDRRWTREHKREILRSRTEGTGLLASALASLRSKPGVFVSGSATGYYGDGGDHELTESSPAGRGFLAADRETTGSHLSRRVQEAPVRHALVVTAAGHRTGRNRLMIRRAQGRVLPAPSGKETSILRTS